MARTWLVLPREPADRAALVAHPPAGRVRRVLKNIDVLIVEADDPRPWRRDRRVASIEADRVHHPAAATTAPPPGQVSWNVAAVRAPAAWAFGDGAGARVMVLDSGADAGHPLLVDVFAKGRNFCDGDQDDFADRDGHGTHVAGTIARVAPGARVWAGRVCANDQCPAAAVAAGLDWAITERVDVVNLSIAGDTLTRVESRALARAEAAGVIVAAASGNAGVGVVAFPAAVDTVLAVGAVDRDRHVPRFSQWGPALAVVAPGVAIRSSVPRGTGRAVIVAVDGRRVPARAAAGSPVGDMTATLADARDADVRDRVVLISAAITDAAEAARATIARGAAAVVLIDDDGRRLVGALGPKGVDLGRPVALLDNAAGEDLRARLATGPPPRVRVAVRAGDYDVLGGSSTATPHVAGALALLRGVRPDLSPAAARDAIRRSAVPVESNVNARSGRGLLDAAGALDILRANQVGSRL